jgi:hypothetical protein
MGGRKPRGQSREQGEDGRLPKLSLRGLDLESVLGAVLRTPAPAVSALPKRAKKAKRRPKARKR